ncbi:hypothetical protein FV113G1_12910 [Fusobacterium varium]|nr:hypothetical protein FV113G1_12910 [Fusobacterium varium]
MANNIQFLTAKDVSEILSISKSSAYRIIKQLNIELKKQNKIIISGKISRRYFEEKMYL